MKNSTVKAVAATALSLIATNSFAGTVIVDYDFKGDIIENTNFPGPNPGIDLDGNGSTDLTFLAFKQQYGPVRPTEVELKEELVVDLPIKPAANEFGALILGPDPFAEFCLDDSECLPSIAAQNELFGPINIAGGFARENGALKTYERGDIVQFEDGVSFAPDFGLPFPGPIADMAILYDTTGLSGQLDEIRRPDALGPEETAIFGFMFTVFPDFPIDVVPFAALNEPN